jgi:hypothetical protein
VRVKADKGAVKGCEGSWRVRYVRIDGVGEAVDGTAGSRKRPVRGITAMRPWRGLNAASKLPVSISRLSGEQRQAAAETAGVKRSMALATQREGIAGVAGFSGEGWSAAVLLWV